jgi:uncharacterized RDD family membrane protein YckC
VLDGFIFAPFYAFHRITFDQTGAILAVAVLHLISSIYNILMLAFCGQTLGMMAAGIKVFRLDLSPLRFSNAFLRYLVNFLIGIVYVFVVVSLLADAKPEFFERPLFGVLVRLSTLDEDYKSFMLIHVIVSNVWVLSELIVLLMNEKRRALHDFIGGTVIVRVDENKGIRLQSQPSPRAIMEKLVLGLTLVLFTVGLIGIGISVFFMKSNLGKLKATPAELQTIGVRNGKGFATASTFAAKTGLGATEDLVADPAHPGSYLIVGKTGAGLLGPNGEVTNTADFDLINRFTDLRWVVVGNWIGLMERGSWIQPAVLMDRDGKTLWTYSAKDGNNDMAAVNMGNGEKPAFAAGANGGGGIHLLDSDGHQIWKKPGNNIWSVQAADLDGSGKDSIIHSNAAGALEVMDTQGNPVREFKPGIYASRFFVVPWNGSDRFAAVIAENTKYLFYGLNQGVNLGEWDTGIKLGASKAKAVWVDWNDASARSLALLTSYSTAEASFLTLFDVSGQIQYQEVFGEACGALAVVEGSSPGTHDLLCGCDNKVLRYQKAP